MLSFPCFLPTAAIRKRCNQALVTTVILLLSEFHRVSVSLFYFILFYFFLILWCCRDYGHCRVESSAANNCPDAQSSRVYLFTFAFYCMRSFLVLLLFS